MSRFSQLRSQPCYTKGAKTLERPAGIEPATFSLGSWLEGCEINAPPPNLAFWACLKSLAVSGSLPTMIVATGDPRLMHPDDWSRLPSVSVLPIGREVFGFEENGSRWIVGWVGSWVVRHAGRAGLVSSEMEV